MGYLLLEPSVNRRLQTANSNRYRTGTIHLNRVMDVHDIVLMLEGSWAIEENGISYTIHEGDVIVLAAGNRHLGKIPCEPGTRTIYFPIYPHPSDQFVEEQRVVPDGLIAIPTLTNEWFTIESLGKRFGLSPRHLTSIFKNYTGNTVHRFQSEAKIRMAGDLLINAPGMTLIEIAEAYGFYDEYHFGKVFKSVTGQSPGRYRTGKIQ